MRRSGRTVLLGLAVLVGPGAARADETIYIRRGSVWKFFPGLQEPSPTDPGAWRRIGFGDAAWPSGAAPFGYGDPPYGTDLGALDPPMQNNYSTVFLRQEFVVTDPARVAALEANVNYDDGFVAWLNGVEVLRVNVAGLKGDPVAFTGVAAANREPGRFQHLEVLEPNPLLAAGANVLAVMAFNAAKNNNDFKFDLELFDPRGPDLSPPVLSLVVPGPGATVRRLPRLEATFSEEVQGLEPADLLLNGAPASTLSGSGAGPYRFTFPEPAPGRVEVTWAPDHGIRDLSEHPNALAGEGWVYTLDPAAPAPQLAISEFLAAGGGALKDEDGELADWIEIENRGAQAVNLAGFGLTDDPDEPNLWTFPGVILAPGARLLVFASGKDRK
ncbi:MAG: lamin tail domain-containing protein, partial [Thermoanaerobaculia bacterium]